MERKEWTAEKDVGISEYINGELKPIKGTVKARYSDFIVNEIDKTGRFAYVPMPKPTKEDKKEAAKKEAKAATEEEKVPAPLLVLSEKGKEQLKDLLKTTASYAPLIQYIENLNQGVVPKDTIFQFDCTDINKSVRTQFHKAIKEHCPQIETYTVR